MPRLNKTKKYANKTGKGRLGTGAFLDNKTPVPDIRKSLKFIEGGWGLALKKRERSWSASAGVKETNRPRPSSVKGRKFTSWREARWRKSGENTKCERARVRKIGDQPRKGCIRVVVARDWEKRCNLYVGKAGLQPK